MSTFEDCLLHIHEQMAVDENERKTYTEVADNFTMWLVQEMGHVDHVFMNMFKGTYLNNLRSVKCNAYNIFVLLEIPFSIFIQTDNDRPGFVEIKSKAWKSIEDDNAINTFKEMFSKKGKVCKSINRCKFRNWFHSVVETVLTTHRYPNYWGIQYKRNIVAMNVHVKEMKAPFRELYIDFVPAIAFQTVQIMPIIKKSFISCVGSYSKHFCAVPKPLYGCGIKSSKHFSFELANPVAERDVIWSNKNLKIVYFLLKAMRNNYKCLRHFKTQLLTTIFLTQVDKQPSRFWDKPVGDILLHMLNAIIDNFSKGFLPFYWSPQYNLLNVVTYQRIHLQAATLTDTYNRLLKIFDNEENTSYTVDSHFKLHATSTSVM